MMPEKMTAEALVFHDNGLTPEIMSTFHKAVGWKDQGVKPMLPAFCLVQGIVITAMERLTYAGPGMSARDRTEHSDLELRSTLLRLLGARPPPPAEHVDRNGERAVLLVRRSPVLGQGDLLPVRLARRPITGFQNNYRQGGGCQCIS